MFLDADTSLKSSSSSTSASSSIPYASIANRKSGGDVTNKPGSDTATNTAGGGTVTNTTAPTNQIMTNTAAPTTPASTNPRYRKNSPTPSFWRGDCHQNAVQTYGRVFASKILCRTVKSHMTARGRKSRDHRILRLHMLQERRQNRGQHSLPEPIIVSRQIVHSLSAIAAIEEEQHIWHI